MSKSLKPFVVEVSQVISTTVKVDVIAEDAEAAKAAALKKVHTLDFSNGAVSEPEYRPGNAEQVTKPR